MKRGVFANKARAVAGLGGLGALNSGIFAGPTALGIPLGGLGEVTVPANCWDTPGFKECHDQFLQVAQNEAADAGFTPGTAEYDAYVQTGIDNYMSQTCIPACQAQLQTGTTTTKPPTTSVPTATVPTQTQPPVAQTPPATGVMGFLTSKFIGLPMYAWLGVAGVLMGVAYAASKRQRQYAY